MARPNRPNPKPKGKPKPGDPKSEVPQISPVRLALFAYGLPMIFLVGVLIFATRAFSLTTREVLALDACAQPFRAILSQWRAGLGLWQTPALYALGMHVYLFLSGGAIAWLRAPSLLFYVAGLWFLSRAASGWGEGQPSAVLLLMAALWPYGFHYGTLADSSSFAFLLICLLIYCYIRYGEAPGLKLWMAINAVAVALVYTTYLGWAVLAFLGVQDWLRSRERGKPAAARIAGATAFVAALYIPMWPAFARDLARAAAIHRPVRQLALNAAYNLYVLMVSESIAPWVWRFALPAAIAIVLCLALALAGLRGPARRFLLFGLGLLLLMDFAGSLEPSRLLLIAPWFLLPIAVALGTFENAVLSRVLVAVAVLIGALGWFGAYAHEHYAEVELFEPWPQLSAETAGAMREGAGLINDSDPFFLYLTYALGEAAPELGVPWRYVGSLPETVRDPHVWTAASWQAAGSPVLPYMIWLRASSSSSDDDAAMDAASKYLDQHCGGRRTQFLQHDPAYSWAGRLYPYAVAEPWRIEIHQFLCEQPPSAAAAPPAAPKQFTPKQPAPKNPAAKR